MFKKAKKGTHTVVHRESDIKQVNSIKKSKNFTKNFIGSLNVKRWNELKSAFSCKNDEQFVTKLLDIAQEHFDKNNLRSKNFSSNEIEVTNKQNKTKKNYSANKKHRKKAKEESTRKNIVTNNEKEERNESDIPQKENVSKSPLQKTTEIKSNKFSISSDKEKIENTLNGIELEEKIDNNILNDNPQELFLIKDLDRTETQTSKEISDVEVKNCQRCNTSHNENRCPIDYPHYIIIDSLSHDDWAQKYKIKTSQAYRGKIKIEKPLDLKEAYSFSVISIPNVLDFGDTNTDHGVGVFAKDDVQPFTQFGPLIGQPVKEVDIPEDFSMRDLWEVYAKNGNIYFNTEDVDGSNWTRYIRPAPKRENRNLSVATKNNNILFVAVKLIKSGEELLYWQDSAVSTGKKNLEKTMCGGCNMVFSHPLYYRIHCSIFHDIRYSLTIRKYHCKICGAAVLGKENIMKHAAKLHNGEGAYQCQFCKKFFLRLNYLEMHRTYGCSANPHRSRPLCDFCGKKFCQPQKLKVHIKRMHSDIADVLKEFQCKNCLKILGSRAALQRHTKEVHQKQVEGTCACSRCGKRFQNKSNLKIHMLTHSGIKPFRCNGENCTAAFTTKQCLQFHYKKVHNLTEENMPKIERSVDYTFKAYSGSDGGLEKEDDDPAADKTLNTCLNPEDEDSDSDNASSDSRAADDPLALPPSPQVSTPVRSPDQAENCDVVSTNVGKVLSKGSKKWMADEPLQLAKLTDMYSMDRLNKEDLNGMSLHDPEIYARSKLDVGDFNRHETSNASLLVEAALDSVCSEPNIDIDVGTAPNCADSLVNNLYSLTQSENLPGGNSYADSNCMTESRDINLISPSVNDHISVTDELSDELRRGRDVGMDYSNFNQEDFSPSSSPGASRPNFVQDYVDNLSPRNNGYDQKSPVPSPPRYDFGHGNATEHLSSDDSDGMAAQNLTVSSKNDSSSVQLDLSVYKAYKADNSNYARRMKFDVEGAEMGQNSVEPVVQNGLQNGLQVQNAVSADHKDGDGGFERPKYLDELTTDIRNKFEVDLDLRLKSYENDGEMMKNYVYDGGDLDFRKSYDLGDIVETRSKQYDGLESDFRSDRSFEPLVLNNSELQGLDMSARSFHNYPSVGNRYHHLYPEVDGRVDLRLGYSPPPAAYTHADILRVVSLDLTPSGRHSVDLGLRNHPLHQLANTRLLTDHSLQTNPHRLLNQTRLLSGELSTARHLPEAGGRRMLSDHTTTRILSNSDQMASNHLLGVDQSRLIGDDSRMLSVSDQSRLLEPGRLLSATANGSVSPVQGFGGYSVNQSPYHPTAIAARPPTPGAYLHYPSYY